MYENMREYGSQIFIAVFLIASMSTIAVANHNGQNHAPIKCVLDVESINADSSDDLSECIDTYNYSANNPPEGFEYENATQGYCCSVDNLDPVNQGSYTRAFCLQQDGRFVEDSQDIQNETEACNTDTEPQMKKKTFTGYVKNASNGQTIQDATVNITYEYQHNDEGKSLSNVTQTTTGEYTVEFTVPDTSLDRQSTIRADTSACPEETITVPTNAVNPVENNITLCGEPGDEEEDDPSDDTPICGNGVLENGEQCEPMGSQPANFSDAIPDVNNRVCLNNCQVKYQDESCENMDTCRPGCCQAESDACTQDDGTLKTVCQPHLCSNPSLQAYTTNQNREDATFSTLIGWETTPESCKTAYTTVNVTGPNNNLLVSTTVQDDESYQFNENFEDLNDSEEYTVKVQSDFVSGVSVTNTTTFTPTFICAGREDTSFCTYRGSHGVMTCDGLESDFNPCPNNQACRSNGNQKATCNTTRCERCSGPTDLFASTQLQPPQDTQTCGLAYTQDLCYFEPASQRDTVRGQAESCANIESCADYQSQQTCSNTPCDNAQAQNCDWKSLNDGLGKGFCAPNNSDDATPSLCEQCGFAGCDRELCEDTIGNISGESQSFCYHNEAGRNPDGTVPTANTYDNYNCMAKPASGCATYDTKTACLGEPGNRSEIDLNEDYDRVNQSNDYFGFGTCDWDTTAQICYKDGNDDNQPDCGVGNRNDACVRDQSPPNTTVQGIKDGANISAQRLSSLTLTAKDNQDLPKNIDTSIVYNNTEYEASPMTQLKNAIKGSPPNKVTHTFTYWSQDSSENLEPKQTHTIDVYPDLDETLTLNATHHIYTESQTTIANITATVGDLRSEDPRTLYCTFSLKDGGSDVFSVTSNDSTRASANIPYVSSGRYTVHADCNTGRGGQYESQTRVRVDTDLSITNTQPSRDVVRDGDVTLTAETAQDRRCQYQAHPNDNWTNFTDTGGQVHETTVTRDADDGVVTHQVRCTNNTEWIRGDNQDTIIYAVDETPPSLSATARVNGETIPRTTETEAESAKVTITCNDPVTKYKNTNYSFGCKDTLSYCTATRQEACIPENGETATGGGPIVVTPRDNRTLAQQDIHPDEAIYIRSEDKGNNTRLKRFEVDLKPEIDITPPDTDISGIPQNEWIQPETFIQDIQFDVTDNQATQSEITTKVNYSGETFNVPDDLTSLKEAMIADDTSKHTFDYWSVDPAGNQEPTSNFTTQIYKPLNTVGLSVTTSLYNDGGGLRGSIEAEVGDVNAPERSLECQLTLQGGENDVDRETTKSGDTVTHEFRDLSIGDYVVDALCDVTGTDKTYSYQERGTIDFDSTITNPSPHEEAVTAPVNLGLETSLNTRCQYNTTGGWEDFESNGQTHTANLTNPPSDNTVVTHEVRCLNQTSNEWMLGEPHDHITYLHDTNPPSLQLNVTERKDDGEDRRATVDVICEDNPTTPYNLGCDDQYTQCVGTVAEPCSLSDSGENTSGVFSITTRDTIERRRNGDSPVEQAKVRVTDRGGNTKTIEKNINVEPTFDTTPPNTSIQGLPTTQILPSQLYDATFTVEDNNDTPDDITTKVSFNGETRENNKLGWLKSAMQEADGYTHTFDYWSVDGSGNKEQASQREVTLYPDFKASLNLTLSSSLYNDGQTAKGRVSAQVGDLKEIDSRTLTCTFTLNGDRTKSATGEKTATASFNDLDEATHTVTANCSPQDYNISYTNTESQRIDLSPAIQNTTPYYEPFRSGPIVISADTPEPRQCQYQDGSWKDFTTTGGTTHNATVNIDEETGIIEHNVRCREPGGAWIQGGPTDKIAYGVDTTGPTINITVTDSNGIERDPSQAIVGDYVNVGFTCQDRPDQTHEDEQIRFDCPDTTPKYVCQGTEENPCTPTKEDENVTTDTFEVIAQEDQDVDETITVLAEDTAGNTATSTHTVNLIDDSLSINVDIQPR